MAKKTSILWMPLFISDYLGDTMHLSTEEHGAYLLLLMAAWKNAGKLPADEKTLKAITKLGDKSWKESRSVLLAFFFELNGSLRNNRVDAELTRTKVLIEQRSEAGKASAAKKKQERIGQQIGNENSTSVERDAERDTARNRRQLQPQNLPTVVLGKSPSQAKQVFGEVDTDSGEVLSWAN